MLELAAVLLLVYLLIGLVFALVDVRGNGFHDEAWLNVLMLILLMVCWPWALEIRRDAP